MKEKILARLISYVFHPIFLVPLMAAFVIYGEPSWYLGVTPHAKFLRLLTVIDNTLFFPLFAVLLCKGLGFVKSIQLKDQQDRIIPYVATLTFYFWAWMALRYQADTPPILTGMLFGVFLSASAGLVLNSFLKISMHTIGVGGLVTFMLLLAFREGSDGLGLPLALSILIAGMVWSARLIVSDHTERELSLGFIVGVICQVLGAVFFH
jgi:hypothetical protein